jgi:hypothetical protein
MSIKRSSSPGRGTRPRADDASVKVDRQDLWDELLRRAEANEPFLPGDVAQDIGAPEAAVSRSLQQLAYERLLDKADGGRFRAGPLKDTTQAAFVKALSAKIDPKRGQDQLEIERLKRNNDEMRRRLLEAVAERDRLVALLRKHGIDPAETP